LAKISTSIRLFANHGETLQRLAMLKPVDVNYIQAMKYKRLKILVIQILAAAITLFLGNSAFAIDCTKASTEMEKAICAEPDLIAKDAELNADYSVAYKSLLKEERAALVKSQQQWVAWTANANLHRYQPADILSERIALLKSLKVKQQSPAQHFADVLRKKHKGEFVWYAKQDSRPLTFPEMKLGPAPNATNEQVYVSEPETETEEFQFREEAKVLLTALTNGGMSEKELQDTKEGLQSDMSYSVENVDFSGDGIPDFLVSHVLGTEQFTSTDYYLSTSVNPSKAHFVTSSPSQSGWSSFWGNQDQFTAFHGKPLAVWLGGDGYTFTDFTTNPPTQSFLEFVATNVSDLPTLERCKLPTCTAVFSDLSVMDKANLANNEPLERLLTAYQLKERSWTKYDGTEIDTEKFKKDALPEYEFWINRQDWSRHYGAGSEPETPSIKLDDLKIADINNDGTPEVYALLSAPEGASYVLVYVVDRALASGGSRALYTYDLLSSFKTYDPIKIGWASSPSLFADLEEAYWGGDIQALFEDKKGGIHLARFGSQFFVGGHYQCCHLEIKTIRGADLQLDYVGATRERLKVTNVIGFGNQEFVMP
jgi:uncharacterized protein YecT (DUF1311 family)